MKKIEHKYLSFLTHFFIFLYLSISISGDPTATYSPTDNIALDCGSSANSQALDGRNWLGDARSEFGPVGNDTSVNVQAPSQGNSIENVPYMTARISRSQFTYSFRVTAGQKFIRLYFYPASYQGFDKSKAFFSVNAGRYTLLSNFSASLTADSLGFESFTREFCVNVDENQLLNITFSPSPSTDAYAFINGIEIVSMPTNLYYTRAPVVGQQNQFLIDNNMALEMVHRLNVGGRSISPLKDSGMFRRWSEDTNYSLGSGVVLVSLNLPITYTKIPAYTAPVEIYQTARSMGWDEEANKRGNLTWKLPVDSGFSYLVRLHFCEFEPQVTNVSGRVFEIYINNQTAEDSADVVRWSGGSGIPVYKDYVVMIESQGIEGKSDLLIALHPNTESETVYFGAILNGLEMFKINNSGGNLAGLNPPEPQDAQAPSGPSGTTARNSITNKVVFIAIGGSAVAVLVIICLFCYFLLRRLRKGKDRSSCCGPSWLWWWLEPCKGKYSMTKEDSSLPRELWRHFSLSEIRKATKNFSPAFIIGKDGYGNRYKGCIDSSNNMVSIKRYSTKSQQGASEFRNEIEVHSLLRHLHIVPVVGICNDGDEMIIVHDYMTNGTLSDHLYEKNNDPLPWKLRLEICIGAAKGLHYLHEGVRQTVIHRDFKTSQILLDEKWVAKISDFGLSRMVPTSTPNGGDTTRVVGTLGYLDPEYLSSGRVTAKSDVFSFGVVLFEVLCARRVYNSRLDGDQIILTEWAQNCIRNKAIDQLIDPSLMGSIAPACLKKFLAIAQSCIRARGIERPTMAEVVRKLEFALQLQESAEATNNEINFSVEAYNEYTNEDPSLGAATSSAPMGGHTGGQSFSSLDSVNSLGSSPSARY